MVRVRIGNECEQCSGRMRIGVYGVVVAYMYVLATIWVLLSVKGIVWLFCSAFVFGRIWFV